MTSVEYLRAFVSERLAAAAEEIFGAFKKIIFDYEEEIIRQRGLLDINWKHEVQSHGLPQQHVCEEEEDFVKQQHFDIDMKSGIDPEDAETPQMKEEQQELCTSQKEEHLVVKQETDTFMLTSYYTETDQTEDKTPYMNPHEHLRAAHKEAVPNKMARSPVEGEANSNLQLLPKNSHAHVNRDQEGGTCTKELKFNQKRHFKVNTGDRPYVCQICEKDFKRTGQLTIHMRIHTGEKPYICNTCGKDFKTKGELSVHMRIHTGEKPYVCSTCGKDFMQSGQLTLHTRKAHTGEKPYVCKICGKSFTIGNALTVHMRIHTGEKPYVCKICGKDFRHNGQLAIHMRRAHTGEKPYVCKVGVKSYCSAFELARHRRSHTDRGTGDHIRIGSAEMPGTVTAQRSDRKHAEDSDMESSSSSHGLR